MRERVAPDGGRLHGFRNIVMYLRKYITLRYVTGLGSRAAVGWWLWGGSVECLWGWAQFSAQWIRPLPGPGTYLRIEVSGGSSGARSDP